ncbi:MAG: ATP-dependent zinc metalloprotease FtsH [bacterium]|nr:ATP-dependent zinc metalloprotease FtsH [bacterium]
MPKKTNETNPLGGPPPSTQPPRRRVSLWFWLFLALLTALAFMVPTDVEDVEQVPLSTIIQDVKEGKVAQLTVKSDTTVRAELKNEFGQQLLEAEKEPAASIYDYGITADQTNIKIDNNTKGSIALSVFLNFMPVLLLIGFIYFIARQSSAQNARAMSFGRSNAKLANASLIKFKDVAGLKEAKVELMEIVEFLRSPKKFTDIGAEIPKGVILTGPPGTGKTLLAKAVAGEASVPFFTISASEFVEMFVGVGASRVRDLFTQAKRHSPAIIFIDELDAIGRQRGAGLGGSHDEREQTLNQILVEMDGFGTDTHVIIMAATNRPDILDPALLRPGRFDRRIVIDEPTRSEREEVLRIHTFNKPLGKDVDLDKIAAQTAGFSGADLKNVANEAAILTARDNRHEITQADFHDAVEKVLMGPERSARMLNDEEKKITAYHEAGHAITGHVLPLADPIHKVSIISRGQALGVTWSLPTEDRHLSSRTKYLQEISVLLGGRVSEELFMKDITTGASNDLKRATQLARAMVTQLGMSAKLGERTFGDTDEMIFLGREIHEQRNYSEEMARDIDTEVAAIIATAKKTTQTVLKKYHQQLAKLAAKLLLEESVEGSYLDTLIPLPQVAS